MIVPNPQSTLRLLGHGFMFALDGFMFALVVGIWYLTPKSLRGLDPPP